MKDQFSSSTKYIILTGDFFFSLLNMENFKSHDFEHVEKENHDAEVRVRAVANEPGGPFPGQSQY